MKLRNKKTGETGYYLHTHRDYKTGVLKVAVLEDGKPFSEFKPYEPIYDYDSLAELNEEWEDAPEKPKGYWFIDAYGNIVQNEITKHYGDEYTDMTDAYESQKQIGNHFETPEEAEKAVEKIKAWKRLKDGGFRFTAWKNGILLDETVAGQVRYEFPIDNKDDIEKDLDLLFGGGE